MLILKLPPFFPHRIADWKSAANSKQTFIWSPSIRSYIILDLTFEIRHTVYVTGDRSTDSISKFTVFADLNKTILRIYPTVHFYRRIECTRISNVVRNKWPKNKKTRKKLGQLKKPVRLKDGKFPIESKKFVIS